MEQRKYEVTKGQILLDLKVLAEGIFEGEVRKVRGESGAEALLLAFTNGQVFRIDVTRLA